MTRRRRALAWLTDRLLGPRCPHGCGHRARGWRTLADHLDFDHHGELTP